MRRAHAAYYLALVEAVAPALTGPDQALWLDRLEHEHDNLRTALQWTDEGGDAEHGWRLAGALCEFWLMRGHLREGREWLRRLLGLAAASSHSPARARALTGAGHLAHNLGDYAAAWTLFEESLALWRDRGDPRGTATALNNLGWVAVHRGDYPAARALSEESLALWREIGDPGGMATALNNLGFVAYFQGAYAAAAALHQESLDQWRVVGDQRGMAMALSLLGRVAQRQGNAPRATACLEDSLRRLQALGMKQLVAWVASFLADVMHEQGDERRATALVEESVALCRDLGDQDGLAYALSILGTILQARGDVEQARALLRRQSAAVSGPRGPVGDGDRAAASGYSGARAGRWGHGTGAVWGEPDAVPGAGRSAGPGRMPRGLRGGGGGAAAPGARRPALGCRRHPA